jgi:hypothetical protein
MKAQIKKWLTFNDTEVGMLFIADCIDYIGGAYDVAVDVVLIAGTRITPVLTRSERGLK